MDTVKINHGNTKMIAHRGLSGIEQENTNAAFVAAGNRSYYGIETDVHRTADGQYVIIHDDTTARVTNGAWDVNVEQVPYRDIQAILLPDRDGSCTRQDLRIPLLAEYVRICKRYEKVCVLELKNPFLREDIENIIEIVRGGRIPFQRDFHCVQPGKLHPAAGAAPRPADSVAAFPAG